MEEMNRDNTFDIAYGIANLGMICGQRWATISIDISEWRELSGLFKINQKH